MRRGILKAFGKRMAIPDFKKLGLLFMQDMKFPSK